MFLATASGRQLLGLKDLGTASLLHTRRVTSYDAFDSVHNTPVFVARSRLCGSFFL